MQQKRHCRRCGMGKLPASAPLANPYVPFQAENPEKYDTRKALIRGTLYQGLDLPFMGQVNKQELPVTPLSELQALSFALQELTLYLDTHRDDHEALAQFTKVQQLLKDAKEKYEKHCGSLTHMSPGDGRYRWLDDPWPWEYAMNRRG